MRFKRVALVAVSAAAVSSLAVLPANAAGIPNTAVPGTEDNTYVRQTQTVRDAGGQEFTISVLWTETYRTAAGNYRVGATVRINASGVDLDEDGPGDGGLDASVKTYQGYASGATKLIQSSVFDGASDPLNFNNANPLNRPNGSKVVVTAGVNDDGYANSPAITFLQPVIGDEDPGADGEGVEAP